MTTTEIEKRIEETRNELFNTIIVAFQQGTNESAARAKELRSEIKELESRYQAMLDSEQA